MNSLPTHSQVIQYRLVDVNKIKQNTVLATSEKDTYIHVYFTVFTISDTFGNRVVEMHSWPSEPLSTTKRLVAINK